MAAAAGLADSGGLGGLTLSALARELGVRTPSLYSHVRSLEDLRVALTTLALSELADRVDRALAGRSGREALVAWAEVHRGYAHEHPGRFAAAGLLDGPVTPELEVAGARLAEQSSAVLRGYPVPRDERVHASRLLASVLRGFAELETGGAFGHRSPSTDDSWRRVLDSLHRMLTDWSDAAAPPASEAEV